MRSLLVSLLLLGPVQAEIPRPDARGEYTQRTLHTRWKVVDPDPGGLNGRLSPKFPLAYDDITQEWPLPNVAQWPIVARFAPGSILQARTGNVGVIRQLDPQGRAWMMVSRPTGQGFCFVRAHRRYIQPVP